jgi:hypothetical protein
MRYKQSFLEMQTLLDEIKKLESELFKIYDSYVLVEPTWFKMLVWVRKFCI